MLGLRPGAGTASARRAAREIDTRMIRLFLFDKAAPDPGQGVARFGPTCRRSSTWAPRR